MNKKTALSLAVAMATGAMAQEASSFKVYGFADASLEAYQLNNSFASNFVGTDTLSLSLNRVNLYFDFKPNEHIKGLVEIGLMSRPKYTTFENGSDPAVISYQGKALNDSLVKSFVTDKMLAFKLDSLAQLGTPQATLDAMAPAIRSQIAVGVEAKLQPQLTAMRQKITGTAIEEKRDFSLERAQFDLMIHDRFNLRVGKWITPPQSS